MSATIDRVFGTLRILDSLRKSKDATTLVVGIVLLLAHGVLSTEVSMLPPPRHIHPTGTALRHDRTQRLGPGSPKLLPPAFILSSRSRTLMDIEPLTRRNVTTQVGQTVYLRCLVEGIEDPTVSWVRLRDFHLLTVKLVTYTSEENFTPVHLQHSKDWALQIKYTQKKDEGYYECQVNTNPVIVHHVFLRVLEPKAKILGGSDYYVEGGSALNLTCIIEHSPEPPAFVFWYHGDRMINFDPEKGDISIRKASGDSAVSRLFLVNAQPMDSGNYTCCPSNAAATSIMVHVIKGEKQAAVQNDARPLTNAVLDSPHTFSYVLHLCAILLLLFSNLQR